MKAHELQLGETDPQAIHDRWHASILTTVFWVGEPSGSQTGYVSNRNSAWDAQWVENFGGTDHPFKRIGFQPAGFKPKQNPFYVALPFNDLVHRLLDRPVVCRFLNYWKTAIRKPSRSGSLCKNQWLAIRFQAKTCFAQWQDVGPLYSDDDSYVFGFHEPRSHALKMAGLDVSPAVRDFLSFPGNGKTDWHFVAESMVPPGPWSEIVTRD